MAAATLIVYLQSQLQSNDALFLFISSNLLVNICMIGLSSYLVWLSFQSEFKRAAPYVASVLGAVLFTIAGMVGILSASFDRYMFDVIKPLDYVLLFEAGILLGICALSYKHPVVSFSIRLPRLPVYRLRQFADNLLLPPASGGPKTSRPSAA